ncbi:2-C-methyl-D-erythritol 4-phosphate cytidylyltransferase, partial [Candidatus Omnitrophota bacterium]
GERMGLETPKQFLELAGKPIIVHTLGQFEKNDLISDIVVVCHENHIKDLDELLRENRIQKIHKIVPGGETRQESSFIGVKSCPPGTEFVLIHDAVRPFIDDRIIEETLAAAAEAGASGTAIDTDDTIIVKKDDFIEDIPPRKNLKRIQTPQGFRYETILEAHQGALKNNITDSTDDCGLVRAMGQPVKLVDGSVFNIKITDQTDLFLAEKFFQSGKGSL